MISLSSQYYCMESCVIPLENYQTFVVLGIPRQQEWCQILLLAPISLIKLLCFGLHVCKHSGIHAQGISYNFSLELHRIQKPD